MRTPVYTNTKEGKHKNTGEHAVERRISLRMTACVIQKSVPFPTNREGSLLPILRWKANESDRLRQKMAAASLFFVLHSNNVCTTYALCRRTCCFVSTRSVNPGAPTSILYAFRLKHVKDLTARPYKYFIFTPKQNVRSVTSRHSRRGKRIYSWDRARSGCSASTVR